MSKHRLLTIRDCSCHKCTEIRLSGSSYIEVEPSWLSDQISNPKTGKWILTGTIVLAALVYSAAFFLMLFF